MNGQPIASLYIGGTWRTATGAPRPIRHPYDGSTVAVVADATERDVAEAVEAARHALPAWSATSIHERRDALVALRRGIADRRSELARLAVGELGVPVSSAEAAQVDPALGVLDSYIDLIETYPFEEQVAHTRVLKRAAGVVAAVTPWNYALYQLVLKLAPALAAGCTLVAKPAELTPLTSLELARIAHAAGLPAGVLNVITGPGATIGNALVGSSGVDVVSFTGSVGVGRSIGSVAGAGLKRVCLELGGKSASIVLPGSDVAQAAEATMRNVAANSGQTCAAWTRLLVPSENLADAVAVAAATADDLAVGDPADPDTHVGPVISVSQRERIEEHLREATEAGARIASERRATPAERAANIVVPTVVTDAAPTDRISQEEIFGPVLVVLPYRDLDEAVDIANGTDYGLGGAVWGDPTVAERIARRLETGRVDINGAAWNPAAPFGGMKSSGVGREMGRWGLEEYLETTAVQIPVAGGAA